MYHAVVLIAHLAGCAQIHPPAEAEAPPATTSAKPKWADDSGDEELQPEPAGQGAGTATVQGESKWLASDGEDEPSTVAQRNEPPPPPKHRWEDDDLSPEVMDEVFYG